jgi:hypothetical protein
VEEYHVQLHVAFLLEGTLAIKVLRTDDIGEGDICKCSSVGQLHPEIVKCCVPVIP